MHPPLHDIPEAIAAVFICAVLGIIAKFVIEAGIGFDGSSSDSSGGSLLVVFFCEVTGDNVLNFTILFLVFL
jgi:hypothetical protein